VDLVNVDVLGAETPERVADLLHDSSAARVPDHVAVAPPLEADLVARMTRSRAPSARRPSDDLSDRPWP